MPRSLFPQPPLEKFFLRLRSEAVVPSDRAFWVRLQAVLVLEAALLLLLSQVFRLDYTISLLMWAAPVLMLANCSGKWRKEGLTRSFWLAALYAFATGGAVALAAGRHFYSYPNADSYLAATLPSFDLAALRWLHGARIPLEDIVFYPLAVMAINASYLWLKTHLARVGEREEQSPSPIRWRRVAEDFAKVSVFLFAALLVLTAARAFLHQVSFADAFPVYLGLQLLAAGAVILALWRHVAQRIHLLAVGLTMAAFLALSLVYEIVLALPRGWWGYEKDAMLGIHFSGVPIECPLLWGQAVLLAIFLLEALRAPAERRS